MSVLSLGNPLPQFVLQGLGGLFQFLQERKNRPPVPTPATQDAQSSRSPWATRGGGPYEGTRIPFRFGSQVQGAAPGLVRGSGDGMTLPGAGDLNLGDILTGFVGDRVQEAQAQEAYNQRILGHVGDIKGDMAGDRRDFRAAGRDIDRSTRMGEEGYERGREALSAGLLGAEAAAREGLQNINRIVDDFRQDAAAAYANIEGLRGDVLADFKDQVAIKMANASEAVLGQTSQQISDTVAEMRAAGVPEAQIRSQVAQISASGQKQLGDLMTTIAGNESARYTDVQIQTGNWVADITKANLTSETQLAATVAAEAGATFRNLSAARENIAKASAGLEEAGANWRSNQSLMKSELVTYAAQTALAGNSLIGELLLTVQDPIVQLGDILQGVWSMRLGLEDYEYSLAVGDFESRAESMDRLMQTLNDAVGRIGQINELRHQEGVARNQRSQDRVAGIGEAMISGGSRVAAAAM